MILQAFSKHLQSYASEIPSVIVLTRWLKDVLHRPPYDNVTKIIHTELTLIESPDGLFTIVGTDRNGQRLLESLCRFAESYDQQNFSRWLHKKKANDFKKLQKRTEETD